MIIIYNSGLLLSVIKSKGYFLVPIKVVHESYKKENSNWSCHIR